MFVRDAKSGRTYDESLGAELFRVSRGGSGKSFERYEIRFPDRVIAFDVDTASSESGESIWQVSFHPREERQIIADALKAYTKQIGFCPIATVQFREIKEGIFRRKIWWVDA
jgi:hypothetical protein